MLDVAIIGVPYDLDRAGSGMGLAPEALLDAGLAERVGRAGGGAVLVQEIVIDDDDGAVIGRIGRIQADLAAAVAEARRDGFFPLVIGGDCMNAVGAVAGLGGGERVGVAWIDAHGDYNTPETTLTGYLGGMPLACVAGYGLAELRSATGLTPVPTSQIVLLGPRDLDAAEEQLIVESGATLVRPLEVPASDALNAALEQLDQVGQVYLHIDLDVLDPSVGAGWNYQVPGGLQQADLEQLVAEVLAGENVAAVSVTALNPERDRDGAAQDAAIRLCERIVTYLAQG